MVKNFVDYVYHEGSENWNVLSSDSASSQCYPVHGWQVAPSAAAEPEIHGQSCRRDHEADRGNADVFPAEQRKLHHVQ